jgi:hypothetical protein
MNNKLYRSRALRSLLFFILAGVQYLQAQAPVPREYQVKAAFLYNFSQFIEWPPESFPDNESPFIIGILGNDPFGSYLDEVVSGEKTMGHPIVVKRYNDAEDISNCHILFINSSYSQSEAEQLRHENILTVSDKNNFTNVGGIIGFFTEAGKIRFNVNIAAARSARLNISSKLLRVAKVTEK